MRTSTRALSAFLALMVVGASAASASTPPSSPASVGPSGITALPSPGPAKPAWRQFRFDAGHTGFNPVENVLDVDNVKHLELAFQDRLGKLVLSSSPAVVNGVAYIASSDGVLWAFPADGCQDTQCTKPLWKSTSLGQSRSSPTVANGIVYVGSQTSADSNDGKLNAFAAAGCGKTECEPLWQGAAGKEAILESSPTVAGNWVYIGAHDSRLYVFPARGCGAKLCPPTWTGVTGGSIESTPTVVNGTVYVGSDDGFLYAFDARGCGRATCFARWRGQLGDGNLESAVFESTPAVLNGVVYIGSQHALAAFDANGCGAGECAPLWQSVDDLHFFGGSPAIANHRIYIGLEENLAVFEADGCGKKLCTPEWLLVPGGASASIVSSPTVANGVVYTGRNTGEVFAFPAEPCGDFTCPAIWRGLINEQVVSSSPTVINGRLYIGSADDGFPEDQSGSLYVFELE